MRGKIGFKVATEVDGGAGTKRGGTIRPSSSHGMSTPGLMALTVATVIAFSEMGGPGGAEAAPYLSCVFNHRFRVEDVATCKYGWEMDACGNQLCTKGPGEFCGGKHMRYGICGEGLMCSNCNRCQGCSSKTFECFEDQHCIW